MRLMQQAYYSPRRTEDTNNWANQVSPGYLSHMVAHPPSPQSQSQSRQIHVNSTIDADIGELVLRKYPLMISMLCI